MSRPEPRVAPRSITEEVLGGGTTVGAILGMASFVGLFALPEEYRIFAQYFLGGSIVIGCGSGCARNRIDKNVRQLEARQRMGAQGIAINIGGQNLAQQQDPIAEQLHQLQQEEMQSLINPKPAVPTLTTAQQDEMNEPRGEVSPSPRPTEQTPLDAKANANYRTTNY